MKRFNLSLILLSFFYGLHAQSVGSATLTVHQNQPGYPIPATFPGFSYEVGTLTNGSDYLNAGSSVFIKLIKNLGPGILRLGGNSSDNIHWTNHARTAATGKDSLATTDIDNFTAFAKATGWQVLFGLDLGENKPELSASEAKYIVNSMKGQLYALQIGNEPDLFKALRPSGYTYAGFESEWETYYSAIRKVLPNVPIAGPDVASNQAWIRSFADKEHNKVMLIDGHHYHTSGKYPATINYQTILQPDTALPGYLQVLRTSADQYHLPYRMSEGNSISRGGIAGVSNVFAAALWTLDFMWTVAENKGQGVNLHGGAVSHYAPIVLTNGVNTPRPGYYAMLAFRHGAPGGNIVPASISNTNYNCTAYACVNGGSTYITLINKDTHDISFTVNLDNAATTLQIAKLTAPAITATTGTTFGGSETAPDGSFTPANIEKRGISGKSFAVTIPASSAAVLTVK